MQNNKKYEKKTEQKRGEVISKLSCPSLFKEGGRGGEEQKRYQTISKLILILILALVLVLVLISTNPKPLLFK